MSKRPEDRRLLDENMFVPRPLCKTMLYQQQKNQVTQKKRAQAEKEARGDPMPLALNNA